MDTCVRLGIYGRRVSIPAKLCKRGLHDMAGYNLGRTTRGVYCKECRHRRQALWLLTRDYDRYWRSEGLLPITQMADDPLAHKDDQAAPLRQSRRATLAAGLTPEGGQPPSL